MHSNTAEMHSNTAKGRWIPGKGLLANELHAQASLLSAPAS
jgi:hypothetical protein